MERNCAQVLRAVSGAFLSNRVCNELPARDDPFSGLGRPLLAPTEKRIRLANGDLRGCAKGHSGAASP
eukprot:6913302-Alexandrium_andersonii.AAC.3